MQSFTTTLTRSGAGSCSHASSGCARVHSAQQSAAVRVSPRRDTSWPVCRAAAAASDLLDDRSSSKYDRILQFVEQHSPVPVNPTPATAACDSITLDDGDHFQQPCWHHSYDEEAVDGSFESAAAACDALDEETLSLASDRAMLVRACAARRQAAAHPAQAHPMAVYQAALVHARLATAAPLLDSPENTWAFGSTAEAKPWFYSYDEEAEGSFEEAYASNGSTQVALQAYMAAQASRKALHEARHAARASRACRRAALRASYGDLEDMGAWVDPQANSVAAPAAAAAARGRQQRKQAAASYASLLPLAAEKVLGQLEHIPARHPQSWQFTWDEEAHGGMGDSILGSC